MVGLEEQGAPGEDVVCYCNQITRGEIESAVKEHGLKDIDAIKRFLREEVVSNCRVLSPRGRCCHPEFQEAIKETLEKI